MRLSTGLILAAVVIGAVWLAGCRSAVRAPAPAPQPTQESLRAAADQVVAQNPELKGNSRWTYKNPRVITCEIKRNAPGADPIQGLVRLTYDEFWQEAQGQPRVFRVLYGFRGGRWVWIAAAEEREGHVYPFEGFAH